MAWQYLLAGIAPAIKAGYLLANKPKPDDYRDKFGEEALNKLIANNQADIVNKTLLNQTTSAAKSLGSRLYQNTQHELDIAKEKGLLSSGQYAQALLSAGSDIQGKVGEQQQQALIQNTQFTAGLKANLDQQRLELGRIKDQAAKDYKAATKQWEAELVGVGMDFANVGANFAQAKFAEARTQRFMDVLMEEYPDWSNLTYQQQNGILLKMQLHQLGYSLPSSIGTPASDTQTGNLLAGKSGTYIPVEYAAADTEMSTTLSPGASATGSETLISGVQNPLTTPTPLEQVELVAPLMTTYNNEEVPLTAPTPPPAVATSPAIQGAETSSEPQEGTVISDTVGEGGVFAPTADEIIASVMDSHKTVSRDAFVTARKTAGASSAYDAMFDYMEKNGLAYDSPAMKKWVEGKYKAAGTYDRFKKIYKAAGGQ